MRVLLGLIKGGLIGGGLGWAYGQIDATVNHGFAPYLLYGLIGALVGLVAGRPLWKQETLWTPVVKAVVGVAVCIGLYTLVVHALGDPKLNALGLSAQVSAVPYLLGAACGVIYGVFVEIDDGGKSD